MNKTPAKTKPGTKRKPKQLPLSGITPSQPAKRPIVQITMEEWKRKFE